MSTGKVENNTITLRVVHISKSYPKGAFEAVIRRDANKQRVKVKQASLGVHGSEVAFEIVDIWAQDISKETGLPYRKITLKKLCDTLNKGSNRQSEEARVKLPLGHVGYFKADVKRAFAEEGYDKVKSVMLNGMELLESLEQARIKEYANTATARDSIARSLYQTFLDTGVDASKFCSDANIIEKYNELVNETGLLV